MIILKYSGGLGNQIFIFSVQQLLEFSYPEQVIKADILHYKNYNVHNGFEIEKVFDIELAKASINEIKSILIKPIFKNGKEIPPFWMNIRERYVGYIYEIVRGIGKIISPRYSRACRYKESHSIKQFRSNCHMNIGDCLDNVSNWYLEGQWQHASYLNDQKTLLKKKLRFRTEIRNACDSLLIESIKKPDAVAVHIRKGDYSNTIYDICGKEYYLTAKKIMEKKIGKCKYYIFTNDSSYVKKHFGFFKDTTIISGGGDSGASDLYIMSQCRNFIIANSSYSFWGAFLSENSDKIVVCPKWITLTREKKTPFCVMPKWFTVNNCI